MRTRILKTLCLASAFFALVNNAGAEDIDIYSGSGSNTKPNLLVVMDNSGSWDASTTITGCNPGSIHATMDGTAGGFEACGFYNALTQVGSNTVLNGKINMGLMLFGKGSTQGGVFKLPSPTPPPGELVLMDSPDVNGDGIEGITLMKSTVTALQRGAGSGSDTANGTDVGGAMQEAWAYFTGHTGMSGSTYTAPTGGVCGKNFVIFIGISRTSSNPADSNANNVFSHLQTAGASSSQLTYINYQTDIDGDNKADNKYSVSNNFWGDEWTRFNFESQNIVTYTITLEDTQNPNPDYIAFMKSMAERGGGKAFRVALGDMDALIQALLLIFNEVQSVNSVFASASLPISVNAQGTFLNQIYMGMFRPDGTGLPRWAGNLKQFQFGIDNTDPNNVQLFMADSTGARAISSAGTGFISPNAVSFWTTKNTSALPDNIDPTGLSGTAGGFWINKPQGAGDGFDSPDGEVVEKGGVSQQIRLANLTNNYTATPGQPGNARNVFTCTGSCAAGISLSATPFATTNSDITATLLGTTLPGVTISSITRSSTTATATLASAMSPALTSGQSVTVSGSQYAGFNGTFSVGSPTATTFTYTITATSPRTPATGSYTATVPSSPQSITSLSRSGTTVTATVPAHGYAVGQSVTITGATGSEYNGTFAITTATTNTFTYTIVDGPTTPGSGGSAQRSTDIVPLTISTIVRDASNSSNVSVVTVTTTSPNTYSVGNLVNVSGASPGAYNGSWTVTGIGGTGANKCPNGVTTSGKPYSFCFNINTTPTSPDVTGGMKVDAISSVATISGLSRTTSTCTGGSPSPAATVTATTSAPHNFTTGQTVSIGGTPGADEALYIGSFSVTKIDDTHFSYSITTSPACSDNTTGMTAATYGVDRDTLIKWVRGKDSIGDEPSPGHGITIRPSIHGDVLHSRPAVIDYPSTGVVVFYGSNDGTFRAINGNKTGNIGTVPPGGELWSFIPTEFYSKLQRLYFNSPIIQLPSTPTGIVPTPQPKDYFFDGSIGVYQNVTAGKSYIFLSARRGGRVIYGIDVSSPTDPKLLWKHTNADTGFSELGQTWSQPKVALVKGHVDGNGDPAPVLIFGAGYDPAEDAEPQPDAATRTMGRGIFILDAESGDLLWQAGPGGSSSSCTGTTCQLQNMTYAIPSDVTLVDRDFDTFIDRLYVPDLGGNVWRVDLEPGPLSSDNTPDKWQVTQFAALGGSGTTKRKIFFPPDIVPTKNFDAIAVGTGDREHPTLSNASIDIVNRFYMLKDLKTGFNACDPTCSTVITDNTSSTADDQPASPGSSDLFNATSTSFPIASTAAGFYITLVNLKKNSDGTFGPDTEKGEKVVNAPNTVGGRTFFGTNTPIAPDASVCQPNLGTARGYSVNIVTGEHQFVEFAGGGLPPSSVSGVFEEDGKKYLFCIGCGNPDPGCVGPDCTSPLGGIKPPIPITPVRSRIYWYREHDK